MSFVQTTRAEVVRLKGDRESDAAQVAKDLAVLELLLAEAVGHKRALPGDFISDVLRDKGVVISKEKIQTGLIKRSRSSESNFFIGSCREGFFIMDTAEDVKVMKEFYESRIAAEQTNLANLLDQSADVGLWLVAQAA